MSAAILARAFVVTSANGAMCVKRKSANSEQVERLPRGYFFHGVVSDAWVRRYRFEGGGYVFFAAVREVE